MLAGVAFALSLFATLAASAAPGAEPARSPSVESQAMDIVAWHAGRSQSLGELVSALPFSNEDRDQALRLITDLKLESVAVPAIAVRGHRLVIGAGASARSLEFVSAPRASWKIGSTFVPLAGRPMREAYEEILKIIVARHGGTSAAWSLALPRAEAQFSSAYAASASTAAFAGYSVIQTSGVCADPRGSRESGCSLSNQLNARISRGELGGFECSDNGTLKTARRFLAPLGLREQIDFRVISTSVSGQIVRLERTRGSPSTSPCQLDISNRRVTAVRGSDCNVQTGRTIDDSVDFPLEGLNACCGESRCRADLSRRVQQDRQFRSAPNPRLEQPPAPRVEH